VIFFSALALAQYLDAIIEPPRPNFRAPGKTPVRGSHKRLIPFTALPVGVCNGDRMSYLRKDIGHSLCQSRCVLYIVYMCAQMFVCVCVCVCVCVYSLKVLASEGQTAMINVIFVFYLFRRPRKIFLAKKVGSQS